MTATTLPAVVFVPSPVDGDHAHSWFVPSATTSGVYYRVTYSPDDRALACSCRRGQAIQAHPDARNGSLRMPKGCRHVRAVTDHLADLVAT